MNRVVLAVDSDWQPSAFPAIFLQDSLQGPHRQKGTVALIFRKDPDLLQNILTGNFGKLIRGFTDGHFRSRKTTDGARVATIGGVRGGFYPPVFKGQKNLYGITAFTGNPRVKIWVFQPATVERTPPAVESRFTESIAGFKDHLFAK